MSLVRAIAPLVISISACALSATAAAAVQEAPADSVAPPQFKMTPLLQSTKTMHGQPLVYPEGNAELTAAIGEFPPGAESGRHKHLTPAVVHILEGTLDMEMDGMKHSYNAGDTVIEATDVWMNARNNGSTPARVLIVFAGATGKDNFVRAEEDDTHHD